MGLFLGNEQILDPRYRVRITLNDISGAQTIIEGNLQTEITIGGGANYGKGLDIEQAAGIVSGSAASAIGAARNIGSSFSKVVRGRDVVPVWETEMVWQGGGKPTFEVDLTFVCLSTKEADRYSQDVLAKTNDLLRAVYPNLSGTPVKKFSLFSPPLGYTRDDTVKGKIDLQVGNWLFARKLIAENASFTTSKEVNRFGKPIYATGRITLTPYRSISYKEYLSYFK
jgi:hypothetical protein